MTADTFVENAWYVAGRSQEFPVGQPQGRKIAGRPVLVWRTGEARIGAFDDRCVHKRMPLSEGRVLADGVLECAYHGFCYDGRGNCVRIPSQLDRPIPSRAKLKPFPLIEQDGLVWVWPGDPQKMGDATPPRTPEIGGSDWETHMFDPVHVPANYVLLIENLMDITHFYPLHDGNIGDIEQSKIPIELVEEKLNGVQTVKTVRRVQGYRQPPFMADWFGHRVEIPGTLQVLQGNQVVAEYQKETYVYYYPEGAWQGGDVILLRGEEAVGAALVSFPDAVAEKQARAGEKKRRTSPYQLAIRKSHLEESPTL